MEENREEIENRETVENTIQDMAVNMERNVAQFSELIEAINETVETLGRFTGSFETALERTQTSIQATTDQWSASFREVGSELQRSFIDPFTQGGEQVVSSLGFVGTAITGIKDLLQRIPGIGFITTGVAGFFALQAAAMVVEKTLEARLYRVGAILEGYEDMTFRTAEGMGRALLQTAQDWQMSLAEAEAFFAKIAGVGALAIWESEQNVSTFVDTIMNLSLAAGVSEDVTLGFFQRLFHATDMQRGISNDLADSLAMVYIQAEKSGLGTQNFVNTVMRGAEHMRVFGAEQRTVVESARMLGVMMDLANIPGGRAAVADLHQNVMAFTGQIMRNPAELLFAFGRGEGDIFPRLVEIMEGLQGEERFPGIDPWEVFHTYITRIQDESQMDRNQMGIYLMQKLDVDALQASELLNIVNEMNALLTEQGSLTEEQRTYFEKSHKDIMRVMTDPMDRIKVLLETMMIQLLPRIAQLVTGLLSSILISIPTGIITLIHFLDQALPWMRTGQFEQPAQELQEILGIHMTGVAQQGIEMHSVMKDVMGDLFELFYTDEEMEGKKGVIEGFNTIAYSLKSLGDVIDAFKISIEAVTGDVEIGTIQEIIIEKTRETIKEVAQPVIDPFGFLREKKEHLLQTFSPSEPKEGKMEPFTRKEIKPGGYIHYYHEIIISPADIINSILQAE